MSPSRASIAVVACTLLMAAACHGAHAGGDDYDAAKDVENAGPAYFGFVRDSRGAPVADARVILRPKAGDAVTLKSNMLGLYRSHIRKEVSPEDVVVSCEKDGYKQVTAYRRSPPGSMFVETDCTLQKL